MRVSSLVKCLVVALVTLPVPPALATGSLTYAGPGYDIDLEVGEMSVSVIASVKVTPPGGKAVVLPHEACVTSEFDPSTERLVLECDGDAGQIKPFTLSVVHQHATLAIGETVYRWPHFQWVL